MMSMLSFCTVSVLMVLCDAGRPNSPQTIQTTVDGYFRNLQRGELINDRLEGFSSGWVMELPNGQKWNRSTLRLQAKPIVSLGPACVPFLFKWFMNENLAIRYVAMWSLEQITGISASVYYFDQEDEDRNREKAIRRWTSWWIEKCLANQLIYVR